MEQSRDIGQSSASVPWWRTFGTIVLVLWYLVLPVLLPSPRDFSFASLATLREAHAILLQGALGTTVSTAAYLVANLAYSGLAIRFLLRGTWLLFAGCLTLGIGVAYVMHVAATYGAFSGI